VEKFRVDGFPSLSDGRLFFRQKRPFFTFPAPQTALRPALSPSVGKKNRKYFPIFSDLPDASGCAYYAAVRERRMSG